jgi:hypothetical protein
MKSDKPPSCRTNATFVVGKDSRGNWVAQDQDHLCGGLFISRTEAVKFALFENGYKPESIILMPGIVELDMNRRAHRQEAGAGPLMRQVA